jgi:hypothetical protein
VGARYDTFDRKIDRLSSDIGDLEEGIKAVESKSRTSPGKHLATQILQKEVDRLTAKRARWLEEG